MSVAVDGRPVPAETIRCELNGRERRLAEFPGLLEESWFTTDSLTVSGDLGGVEEGEHDVAVNLKLYIPYIVTDHGVLMIDESREARMTGVAR